MTRFRFCALLLASLFSALPFGSGTVHAERSDPQYGAPSKAFKRGTHTRRKIHRSRPAKPVSAAPPASAERAPPPTAPLPAPNPEREPPQAAPLPAPTPEGEPSPAPVPAPKPAEAAPASSPAVAPVPPEKPQASEPVQPEPVEAKPGEPPAMAPLPAPKPPEAKPGEDGAAGPNEAESEAPMQVPLRAPTAPGEEAACRQRLTDLGAAFTDRPAEADTAGCSVPDPLFLTKLSPTITLTPGALVNCATAEAVTRFAQGPLSAAARASMGEDLVSIDQASAYVCRPRNGTHKLSEHAFGNAIDLSRFTFSKGTVLDVGPAPGAKGESFLAAVRKAACGPFKTVLGPGSDADHAAHLHLDLAPRSNGGTVCQ